MAMSQINFDEDDWTPVTPPNEAEQKINEARRERNNKISSLMGQYLLKGYKMLAITCPHCECILMEDKQKVKYCIACSEVDADTKKDNPAVSQQAARRTVEESLHRNIGFEEMPQHPSSSISANENESSPTYANQTVPQSTATEFNGIPTLHEYFSNEISIKQDILNTTTALKEKLNWATRQLQSTNGVQDSIQLVSLIAHTATALSAINKLSSE